jgi:hypothetical protein
MFYLNCLNWKAGISKENFVMSNIKDFAAVTQSLAYIQTIEGGKIFITEGEAEGTWCAIYADMEEDEDEDDVETEHELIFNHKPTLEEAEYVLFITDIEDYLSDPLLKPFVRFNEKKTHWTELPSISVEDKWNHFVSLREEQGLTNRPKRITR